MVYKLLYGKVSRINYRLATYGATATLPATIK